MNPWLILGAVVFWVVSSGAVYVKGQSVGANRVIAEQAKVNKAIDETRAAAQQGAADAIAKLKPVNTTIRAKTETIVRENTVYRDCLNTPEALNEVNRALAGTAAISAQTGNPKR